MVTDLSKYTEAEIMAPEGAPIPDRLAPLIQAFYIDNEGVKIRVLIARDKSTDPRGTVILVPGRTEFIEKYFEVVEDLIKRRFAVLVLDHRGQGLSTRLLEDRLKCYVGRFQDYADDLGYIIDELGPNLPKPHIVMAHSMGGCIALQSVISGTINPSALICSAPMVGLFDVDTPIMRWGFKILSLIGMKEKNIPFSKQSEGLPVAFKHNKLSSDIERFTRWARYFTHVPALRLGGPTIGWISAALESMKFVNRNAALVKTPTLIISAGGDPIVDPASHQRFAEKSGATLKVVPNALHELFLEKDEYRNQFFDMTDKYLEDNAL